MIVEGAKLLVRKSINEHINPRKTTLPFGIADLGCSIGPNTFLAVHSIIEFVKLKYEESDVFSPEFQVYFNDQTTNDFNSLLKSLPLDREYYANATPGTFYARLFPSASLHVAHCSFSLHWLSRVPVEILDRDSTAYNKGKTHYVRAREEVVRAYANQHVVDFNKFLNARAREIVPGGLLLLVVPARPDGCRHSEAFLNVVFDALGGCLVDLARKGLIDEEKVDTFNWPIYIASPHELQDVMKQNGHFTIEKMESLPETEASDYEPRAASLSVRAVAEEQIRMHFGHEILDQVFELFLEKLRKNWVRFVSIPEFNLFVLLKRKQNKCPAIN
ncbi:S-adenosyl-L-methionine-dependent methyltransferases superfamily protein [Striga hermonthica]|uniref:S-adenosyl-L-methionine-dependent methyltransferases superfamily protein n=1 Tax=Striga hermonthica TaxID=68872 RepID=A0A9N7RN46_STRHE|nr:S-adenosyl-L-methionine-dependent methyltransferases superfamily protein [Striga hermonthica]